VQKGGAFWIPPLKKAQKRESRAFSLLRFSVCKTGKIPFI
jgi:hypothetical protein